MKGNYNTLYSTQGTLERRGQSNFKRGVGSTVTVMDNYDIVQNCPGEKYLKEDFPGEDYLIENYNLQ